MKPIVALLLALFSLRAEAMVITADHSRQAIVFNGDVYYGDDQRLQQIYLEEFAAPGKPLTKIIIFYSGGGLTPQALRMGLWIESMGLDVEVQSVCASSCANYLFLAGKKKIITAGIVGFHGIPSSNSPEEMAKSAQEKAALGGWVKDGYPDDASGERDLKFVIENEGAFFQRAGVDKSLFHDTLTPESRKKFNCPITAGTGVPTIQALKEYGVQEVSGTILESVFTRFPETYCKITRRLAE